MSTGKSQTSLGISEEDVKQANKDLLDYLSVTLKDSRTNVFKLSKKLTITYWIMIILSVLMFVLGIVLLSVPVVAAFKGHIDELKSVIAAGFGISDLAAFFLFRPIEKIHEHMGDMSQLVLVINSYQEQVALRLLQANQDQRDTLGKAADYIQKGTEISIKLIECYFEEDKKKLEEEKKKTEEVIK